MSVRFIEWIDQKSPALGGLIKASGEMLQFTSGAAKSNRTSFDKAVRHLEEGIKNEKRPALKSLVNNIALPVVRRARDSMNRR